MAGGAVGLHGLDQVQAGLREVWTGCNVDSFTSQGLQDVGLSQNTANLLDTGISVAGSLGAGTASAAIRAGGVQNILYSEIGMKTLSPQNWAEYGQIEDPVERGMQLVEDQGWPKAILPDPGGQFSRTIPMGGTPLANGAGGALGALGGFATNTTAGRKGCGS